MRLAAYLNKRSKKFLDDLEPTFQALRPALDLVIENDNKFADFTERTTFGTFLFDLAVNIARADLRQRSEQVNIIRDILVHYDTVQGTTDLSRIRQVVEGTANIPDYKPMLLDVMDQIDAQLPTNYGFTARQVYLELATFMMNADGPLTKKQQIFMEILNRNAAQGPD